VEENTTTLGMSNAGYTGKDGISLQMAGFPGGKGDVCIARRGEHPVTFIGPDTTKRVADAQIIPGILSGDMAGEIGLFLTIVVAG